MTAGLDGERLVRHGNLRAQARAKGQITVPLAFFQVGANDLCQSLRRNCFARAVELVEGWVEGRSLMRVRREPVELSVLS